MKRLIQSPAFTRAQTILKRLIRSPTFWIAAPTAVLYALIVVPHWKPTWDSATYITLAQSLASGDGYTYLGDPHVKYPPGLPLLLMPILLFFGKNYLLMRALIAACAVGSAAAAVLLLRRFGPLLLALAAAAMTAACYAAFFESSRILSDLPYMLASLTALIFMERYRSEPTRRAFWIAACLIPVCYSIRILGFVLAPAFAFSLLVDSESETPRRTRFIRAVAVLGVMALAAAAWMGRNAAVKAEEGAELWESATYERELIVSSATDPTSQLVGWEQFSARLKRNALHYARLTASLLTGKKIRSGASAYLLAALAAAGWILALVRRRGVMEYYSLLYAAVYLLWPAHQGERFLVPLLPMIFYYALSPFAALLEWVGSRFTTIAGPIFKTVAVSIFAAASAVGYIAANAPHIADYIRHERAEPYYRGGMGDYIGAFRWAKENTPQESVLITNRAPYGIIMAERATYSVPWTRGNHEMKWASIERVGATHAIASPGHTHIAQLMSESPGRFREIERFGEYGIYEILDETPKGNAP